MGENPAARELVTIVDEEDRVIGTVPRWEMRKQRLVHRAAYVLVFNSKGQIFVHKRTASKDVYPGYRDVASGGVVLAGETYEEAARRELKEELGISRVEMRFLFHFFHEDRFNRVWGKAFSCVSNGPFTLQEEEVEEGGFMDVEEVLEKARSEPFTPDGIAVLRRYLGDFEP